MRIKNIVVGVLFGSIFHWLGIICECVACVGASKIRFVVFFGSIVLVMTIASIYIFNKCSTITMSVRRTLLLLGGYLVSLLISSNLGIYRVICNAFHITGLSVFYGLIQAIYAHMLLLGFCIINIIHLLIIGIKKFRDKKNTGDGSLC